METRDPIERLMDELMREPLFSERNGYAPLDRAPLLGILDEIEAQYMRLPVDADGVPIRPVDTIRRTTSAVDNIVTVIGVNEREFFFNGPKPWTS